MDEDLFRSNEAAWDRAAQKYAPEVEPDVAFLRDGGVALLDPERAALGDLSGCARAIHLQCSHGLEALSLLTSAHMRSSAWTSVGPCSRRPE